MHSFFQQINIFLILCFVLNVSLFAKSVIVNSEKDFYNKNLVCIVDTLISLSTKKLVIDDSAVLRFEPGGAINVSKGDTLVLNCHLTAGRQQIFFGDGVVIGNPQIEFACPEWFGAKGDFVDGKGGTKNADMFNKTFAFYPHVQLGASAYFLEKSVIMSTGQSLYGSKVVSTREETIPLNSSTLVVNQNTTAIVGNDQIEGVAIKNLSFFGVGNRTKTPIDQFWGRAAYTSLGSKAILLNGFSNSTFDNLEFHNLESAVYSIKGAISRQNKFEDLKAFQCGRVFDLASNVQDITIRNGNLIDRCNYFVYTKYVDGMTISDCTVFHMYKSALEFEGNHFTNISNSKFFETGDTQVILSKVLSMTMVGCSFVRAGMYEGLNVDGKSYKTNFRKTAIKITKSENVFIASSIIERPMGNGIEIIDSKVVKFDGTILYHGSAQDYSKGLYLTGNELIDITATVVADGVKSLDADIGPNCNSHIQINGFVFDERKAISKGIKNRNNIHSQTLVVKPQIVHKSTGIVIGDYNVTGADSLILTRLDIDINQFNGFVLKVVKIGEKNKVESFVDIKKSDGQSLYNKINNEEINIVKLFLYNNSESKITLKKNIITVDVNVVK